MISDLGYYATQLALVAAAAAALAGVVAGITRSATWSDVARRGIYALFALLTLALLSLFHAFATLDFQLAFVAQNAARSMALPYRIAALWGGQAGSLLLWTWMKATGAASRLAIRAEESVRVGPDPPKNCENPCKSGALP